MVVHSLPGPVFLPLPRRLVLPVPRAGLVDFRLADVVQQCRDCNGLNRQSVLKFRVEFKFGLADRPCLVVDTKRMATQTAYFGAMVLRRGRRDEESELRQVLNEPVNSLAAGRLKQLNETGLQLVLRF